jgi:hypothetical protein
VSTCDEGWSPQDFVGIGKPWKRHVRAALSGRFKVARYVAMSGNPMVELPDDQDYELYDLLEDPYELRNLATDRAYRPLLEDMLAVLADLERKRLGPVEVPHYGDPSLLEGLSEDPIGRPETAFSQLNLGSSPVAGLPGAYVQLPIGDPHLEQRVYENSGGERLPLTADESRAMAEARARARAAMLCELGPPPRGGSS